VRPSHREASAQSGDLGEQVGAVELAGRDAPFRVVGRDRTRVDDVGAGRHVDARVADHRLDAVLAQPRRIRRLGSVRARDVRAERARDQR
jgi:hypothetical protein